MTFLARLVVTALLSAAAGHAAVAAETYGRNKWMLCKPSGGDVIMSGVTSATAFTPDGARVAIAAEERAVHVCHTTTGAEIALLLVPSALDEDDDYVNVVAFSPDGMRLVTASKDRMVRLWDVADGRELAAMEHPAPVYFAAFSPDGGHIVTSLSDGKLRLFEAANGGRAAEIEHPGAAYVAVFSPDGMHLVTASSDGTVNMWSMAGTRELLFIGTPEQVYDIAFSPDGTRLVTASGDGKARVYDTASGRVLTTLAHPFPVYAAAFNADGTRVVTGAGNEAFVFDAVSGDELLVLRGHEEVVNDARFSPDGSRIVTASSDRSLRVWDAGTGEEVAVLTGHLGGVQSAAFSPDGQRIFSIGGPEGVLWTKLAAAGLPDAVTGLWYFDFATPDMPLPPEIVREGCIVSPIRVDRDGLVVLFEMMSNDDPPEPTLNLRCTSDLTCSIFAGPPGQGAEALGEGNLAFNGDAADLCLAGECRPIARCPALVWTEEERRNGLADRWETAVLGR